MNDQHEEFLNAQIRGVSIVQEALMLNGFKINESMGISWNVFMNLFREYHANPTHESFTDLVQAFLNAAKEKWDGDPSS